MYAHIYILCIYMYLHVYKYTYMYVYTYLQICMYTYTHTCVTCMYVFLHIYRDIYVSMCMYMHVILGMRNKQPPHLARRLARLLRSSGPELDAPKVEDEARPSPESKPGHSHSQGENSTNPCYWGNLASPVVHFCHVCLYIYISVHDPSFLSKLARNKHGALLL